MKQLFLILVLLCSFSTTAGKLSRAFDALEVYNYFEAKRLFEKSLKKHAVPASYGLSIIYARNDNPFSNLDSALSKIRYAAENYEALKEKQKLKYDSKYGIDSLSIIKQRDKISKLYFERAKFVNSEYAFQDFIDKTPWSDLSDSAIYYRDKVAFENAVDLGGAKDYKAFLEKYPTSVFTEKAEDKYQEMLYVENTYKNNFIDYINFVKNYPNSPFREKAEDRIYEIATETGSVEAFRSFIIEYPANRNIDKAWKHLYNAKLQKGYSAEKIKAFKNEYPDYPYQAKLQKEYSRADKVFYPFKANGKWGFIDRTGEVLVDAKFEAVEAFEEGLAVVKSGGQYGYLNKLGEVVIATKFDDALPFQEGRAVIDVGGLLGMIDRNGDFVVDPNYEDLGNLSDGLAYFLKDSLYGYFDEKGKIRLKPQYTEAYDFDNMRAIVSKNDYYGLIDAYGTSIMAFKYEVLYPFWDSMYIVQLNDHRGVMNMSGDTIIPFEYDYIGALVNGKALLEKEGKFNYVLEDGQFLLNEWVKTYPEYRQLALFKNGYAKIQFENGFNLMDTTGKKLFKREYEDVGSFSDKIAVKKEGQWGYVNLKGAKVLDFQFSYAFSFYQNTAIVKRDPFYGLIDEKGDFIISPYQEEMRYINDSILICKQLGKYGLLHRNGDTLLNYQYINIEPIDHLVVKVEEGGELFYFDLKRLEFIRREE
ncbi:MAG: WG repeat-containing protein [Crocinitomicaceae bacterium]